MIKIAILCLLVLIGSSSAFHHCNNPAGSAGRYLGRDHECAALVQSQCSAVGLTSTWRKGLHVKENCAKIPTLTAIATFLGPNGSYNTPGYAHQHTAIFVGCESAGIRVWDQWNGTPIASRLIRWAGSSSQYSG